ncbi:tRNA (adenosine(37)-N6)-dimethylallyltransferase MiaA [Candidatus Woesebacteria bacterium RIFCSPHIGHO2_01_FULL_44_21]|uniref:tRNA dimethylallyltransferase n=1 Tax=Candidatus Woesebacteria bacterium RIFCSPHIGHO2_01_FULL_44_21 TaxID=1802503 RepID=A0A1F7YWF1_9BACT|nr:MAG: tRNA (adenosine(37)-N6)-dimethylallyltransferase MiaA [Candidatus Woesebacteria bacterium RIFCSPHIGHO2_01_FULL_44_21]OGM70447.1 MAG: tRNA (adenosine(37)-N6)-dimethylallyltransferase MiaA [Candidatus Woesebacteria bacterium RIFCSPLOWO2_01_FULL_44_24b]
MKKLLVICGPTATGKTALATRLAKKFNGELVSADSRQVYKYMDIGTGKDIKKYGKILGYDLVRPDEEFSVSQYVNFANSAIRKIYSQNKLPILVGGTGLYIKAVVDNLDRIGIPRNLKLRKKLSTKTIEELFAALMKISPVEALKLNSSDRANPRRLVRLLEVLNYGEAPASAAESLQFDDVLWVGLRASAKELKKRIVKRVDERIKSGFEKEVEFLKQKDFFKYAPSVTLGYKDWPDTEKWKREEFKYAKRQITWFKKDKRIKWFDVSKKDYGGKIEKLVKKWHNIQNAKEN